MNTLINLREQDIENHMEEAWRVFAIYQRGLFLGLSAGCVVERSNSVIRKVKSFIHPQSHVLGTMHHPDVIPKPCTDCLIVLFLASLDSIFNHHV